MAELTIQEAFALALQHHHAGQLPQAAQLYQEILTRQPQHTGALHHLGVIARRMGRNDLAANLIRQALTLRPDYVEAHNNLGNALKDTGQLDDAIAAFRQAIALQPDLPEAYNNLGAALQAKGDVEEAIAAYRQAIALRPNYPEAHNNLGTTLQARGQLDQAIASYHEAISLKPDYAEAHYNLGNALHAGWHTDEAIAAYRQAIALKPDFPLAHNNLGNALKNRGQLDEAIAAYRQAITLKPDEAGAHSNLIYTLHFQPGYDAKAIAQEHRGWNHQHAAPLKRFIQPYDNDRSPNRRLKIGYVSPDFYDQAESFFTVPLLEHHDHAAFDIHCYSSVVKPDHITERLRPCADVWHHVRGQSDEALAKLIRQDRIDILVDLTMHMGNNRLLTFARKPAPVQVCWLAYPGSSGLESMDYRLTDSFMDPADEDTSCYCEESIRLPDCWVVYDPLIDLPPRRPEQDGPITFGSLNNPAKLNDPLLTLWAKVLQTVPDSRLILQVLSLEHRQRIERLMASSGIAGGRLEFVGRMDRPEYLRSYDRIDIALDPLPYNGITTTCDALYMGTPVLTLAGNTAAGRAGQAMLNTIGLAELVARTPDEFANKAARLAADLPRLIEIRRGLRERLTRSALMDAPRFTRNIEAAYRQMWRARTTTTA